MIKNTISVPKVLTSNTFYWTPGGSAFSRRSNEQRHLAEVDTFLHSLGFTDDGQGAYVKGDIAVLFSYRESCHHVYKHLRVWKDGRRSNITTLYKLMQQ